jgi:hypothetical protein
MMTKVKLPEAIVELFKLEKKYPDWGKTPDNVKEKILELALANGGFGWLNYENETGRNYLDYLYSLAIKLSCQDDDEETLRKLRFFAKFIYDGYSKGLRRKRSTEKKSAKIYVMVEEYIDKNGSSISEATRTIAKELGEKHNYTHKRYYGIKDELKNISLDEVKKRFGL